MLNAPIGSRKSIEINSALARKSSLRNRRTPGAHTPWWAKKPPALRAGGASGHAAAAGGLHGFLRQAVGVAEEERAFELQRIVGAAAQI